MTLITHCVKVYGLDTVDSTSRHHLSQGRWWASMRDCHCHVMRGLHDCDSSHLVTQCKYCLLVILRCVQSICRQVCRWGWLGSCWSAWVDVVYGTSRSKQPVTIYLKLVMLRLIPQVTQLVLVDWMQVTGVIGLCIAWTKLSDWVQKSDAVCGTIIPIATALVYHVACTWFGLSSHWPHILVDKYNFGLLPLYMHPTSSTKPVHSNPWCTPNSWMEGSSKIDHSSISQVLWLGKLRGHPVQVANYCHNL